MYTCVYVCHSNEKAHVYIVYLPVMHIHKRARARCLYVCETAHVSTDATQRRSLGAILTFTLNFYVVFTVVADETSTNRRAGRA